jgi:TetR/AcrR family transcriptional regulator, tetracycline repressor protein
MGREGVKGGGGCAPSGAGAGADGSGGPAAGDRSRRLPLSCERILDAAISYADEHGLGELSMRRLGAELEVEAMSLYRYYPSKGALLEAIACRVLGELRLPPPGNGDWHAHATAYARSLRAAALRHPTVFPLLASTGRSNPALVSAFERMVGMWRAAGLDDVRAVHAQCAVQGYVTGAVLWQGTSGGGAPGGPRPDEDFEFGLGALLAGLGQEIGRVAAPAGSRSGPFGP